jgi:hypothetical protein
MENDIEFTAADFAEGGAFYNNGAGFTPIGTSSSPFTGVFDGNGHVIKGLYQHVSGSGKKYGGLFGYVRGGSIQDLGLEESHINLSNVNSSAYDTYQGYVGGIAGYVANNSTISRCYNTSSVSSSISVNSNSTSYSSRLGGIAGYLSGSTISNCYNAGSLSGITTTTSSSFRFAYSGSTGGISGYATSNSVISSCYNTGSVSSSNFRSSYAAGITGFASGSSTISNCYNTGGVDSTTNGLCYAGGISASADDSTQSAAAIIRVMCTAEAPAMTLMSAV